MILLLTDYLTTRTYKCMIFPYRKYIFTYFRNSVSDYNKYKEANEYGKKYA